VTPIAPKLDQWMLIGQIQQFSPLHQEFKVRPILRVNLHLVSLFHQAHHGLIPWGILD
jgi:hypothetical protein